MALRDQYRNHDLIEIGFGPHSTYQVSEGTLSKVAMLAEELEAPIQIHLHETQEEVLSVVEQSGMRPIDLLEKLGVLGPRTQCVHMTALGEQDMDTIATHGAHVVHCPRSNLKLGSGICSVQKLLDRGINVALGTDGAASNNRLSMLGELQTAALIGKTAQGDPKAVVPGRVSKWRRSMAPGHLVRNTASVVSRLASWQILSLWISRVYSTCPNTI